MPNRFYPGDPCPKCAHPIKRGRRSIWSVFLREAYLKCPNCSGMFVRFPIGASEKAGIPTARSSAHLTLAPSEMARARAKTEGGRNESHHDASRIRDDIGILVADQLERLA